MLPTQSPKQKIIKIPVTFIDPVPYILNQDAFKKSIDEEKAGKMFFGFKGKRGTDGKYPEECSIEVEVSEEELSQYYCHPDRIETRDFFAKKVLEFLKMKYPGQAFIEDKDMNLTMEGQTVIINWQPSEIKLNLSIKEPNSGTYCSVNLFLGILHVTRKQGAEILLELFKNKYPNVDIQLPSIKLIYGGKYEIGGDGENSTSLVSRDALSRGSNVSVFVKKPEAPSNVAITVPTAQMPPTSTSPSVSIATSTTSPSVSTTTSTTSPSASIATLPSASTALASDLSAEITLRLNLEWIDYCVGLPGCFLPPEETPPEIKKELQEIKRVLEGNTNYTRRLNGKVENAVVSFEKYWDVLTKSQRREALERLSGDIQKQYPAVIFDGDGNYEERTFLLSIPIDSSYLPCYSNFDDVVSVINEALGGEYGRTDPWLLSHQVTPEDGTGFECRNGKSVAVKKFRIDLVVVHEAATGNYGRGSVLERIEELKRKNPAFGQIMRDAIKFRRVCYLKEKYIFSSKEEFETTFIEPMSDKTSGINQQTISKISLLGVKNGDGTFSVDLSKLPLDVAEAGSIRNITQIFLIAKEEAKEAKKSFNIRFKTKDLANNFIFESGLKGAELEENNGVVVKIFAVCSVDVIKAAALPYFGEVEEISDKNREEVVSVMKNYEGNGELKMYLSTATQKKRNSLEGIKEIYKSCGCPIGEEAHFLFFVVNRPMKGDGGSYDYEDFKKWEKEQGIDALTMLHFSRWRKAYRKSERNYETLKEFMQWSTGTLSLQDGLSVSEREKKRCEIMNPQQTEDDLFLAAPDTETYLKMVGLEGKVRLLEGFKRQKDVIITSPSLPVVSVPKPVATVIEPLCKPVVPHPELVLPRQSSEECQQQPLLPDEQSCQRLNYSSQTRTISSQPQGHRQQPLQSSPSVTTSQPSQIQNGYLFFNGSSNQGTVVRGNTQKTLDECTSYELRKNEDFIEWIKEQCRKPTFHDMCYIPRNGWNTLDKFLDAWDNYGINSSRKKRIVELYNLGKSHYESETLGANAGNPNP